MTGAFYYLEATGRGDEGKGGGHFSGRAEFVLAAVQEEGGRLYLREVGGTELGWFFGWMQRIGKQEQRFDESGLFGGEHAGLAAAV